MCICLQLQILYLEQESILSFLNCFFFTDGYLYGCTKYLSIQSCCEFFPTVKCQQHPKQNVHQHMQRNCLQFSFKFEINWSLTIRIVKFVDKILKIYLKGIKPQDLFTIILCKNVRNNGLLLMFILLWKDFMRSIHDCFPIHFIFHFYKSHSSMAKKKKMKY